MPVSGEKPVQASGGAVDCRRRRWSEAQKRQIVAESREPGVSVSVVARRYNVNANQVFTWRRQYREPEGNAEAGRLVPVALRNESEDWNRIRNERAERERQQGHDRSQDRGFSW